MKSGDKNPERPTVTVFVQITQNKASKHVNNTTTFTNTEQDSSPPFKAVKLNKNHNFKIMINDKRLIYKVLL